MLSPIEHWAEMGGYAAYVWPAYALALAVLAIFSLGAVRRYRTARRALDAAQRQNASEGVKFSRAGRVPAAPAGREDGPRPGK